MGGDRPLNAKQSDLRTYLKGTYESRLADHAQRHRIIESNGSAVRTVEEMCDETLAGSKDYFAVKPKRFRSLVIFHTVQPNGADDYEAELGDHWHASCPHVS